MDRAAYFEPRGRWAAGVQALCFFLLALGLTASLLSLKGTEDVPVFIRWGNALIQQGPFTGYASIADYPPLGPFLLWIIVSFGHAAGLPDLLALKLAIATFQLAACVIVMRRYKSWTAACLLWLLLTPLGLVNGYIDVFYLPFVLLALFSMQTGRFGLALTLLTAGALIKWQPAVMGPVMLVYAVSRTGRVRQLIWAAPATICGVAVALAFGLHATLHAFLGATGDPFFSGQAFNLDWMIMVLLSLRHGGEQLLTGGILAVAPHVAAPWWVLSRSLYWTLYLTLLAVFAMRRRSWQSLLLTLAAAESIQFTFNTGVHENHSFLVMAMAFVAFYEGALSGFILTMLSALTLANVLLFYGIGMGAGWLGLAGSVALSLLDILMCAMLICLAIASYRPAQPTGETASLGGGA